MSLNFTCQGKEIFLFLPTKPITNNPANFPADRVSSGWFGSGAGWIFTPFMGLTWELVQEEALQSHCLLWE